MATIGTALTAPEAGWERLDDRDVNITYNLIGTQSSNTNNHNSTYTAINNDSEIKFNFTGHSLRLLGSLISADLAFDIFIDAKPKITKYCPANTSNKILFVEINDLQNIEHSITIKNFNTSFRFDAIDIISGKTLNPYKLSQVNKTLISLSSGEYKTYTNISEMSKVETYTDEGSLFKYYTTKEGFNLKEGMKNGFNNKYAFLDNGTYKTYKDVTTDTLLTTDSNKYVATNAGSTTPITNLGTSNWWMSSSSISSSLYCGYDFTTKVNINKINATFNGTSATNSASYVTSILIRGSNDLSTFTTLATVSSALQTETFSFNNTQSFRYYVLTPNVSNSYVWQVRNLKMYGPISAKQWITLGTGSIAKNFQMGLDSLSDIDSIALSLLKDNDVNLYCWTDEPNAIYRDLIQPTYYLKRVNGPLNKKIYDRYGMEDMSIVPKSAWKELTQEYPTVELVTYVPTGNAVSEFSNTYEDLELKLNLKGLPVGQIVLSKESILYGTLTQAVVNQLDDGLPSGIIRILVSFDRGDSWRIYKDELWKEVYPLTEESFIEKGMTISDLAQIGKDDFMLGEDDEISFAYYIEEEIRESNSAKLTDLSLSQTSSINTVGLKEASLYILNTVSAIDISLLGTELSGKISDIDLGKVKYRVLLNGNPYYPADGKFTDFQPTPLDISIRVDGASVLIDKSNTLTVEFEDYWGSSDFWSTTFIGTYSGLIFKEPTGQAYATEIGQVLKYLDIGTLIAGQKTEDFEILLENSYGYDVENPTIVSYTENEGVTFELSKSNSPFKAQEELTWESVLKDGESLKFYLRIATSIKTPPVMGGAFKLIVNADKV